MQPDLEPDEADLVQSLARWAEVCELMGWPHALRLELERAARVITRLRQECRKADPRESQP